MNIKAIETAYKGYKFRSRLEARWAVFFDEIGLEWQYEVEGFELPGGRYLPDFYLPKYGHVEIKPGPQPFIRLPMIYMAGRMGNKCYRPFDIESEQISPYGGEKDKPEVREMSFNSLNLFYTGPFRYGSDDHSFVHGIFDGFNSPSSEEKIKEFSLHGIDRCEIFFALFEDKEAFGTLVELGYAKANGKNIIVGFVEDGTFNSDDYGKYEWYVQTRCNDLWFAAQCANTVLTGTRKEILAKLQKILREAHPRPREQILAQQLAGHSQDQVTVFYGDPLSAITAQDDCGGRIFHGGNHGKDDPKYFTTCREALVAATRARQARFEHGQSGAS